ncbi:hypothetical protein HX001_05850 [Empedobacter brevis]|uniref:Lipoprotein n=1 Tax=Empedobacter brevis TaxID=247 RepID=A0AAJ1QDI7_9FLAO|nr:hypothetical protein [Empedobacter brevis]MDM1072016.1 hypothetical protein [Empedobacter brevis]QHC86316.1 hypothetical protein AS589_16745 [Empedobacter brevis]
MIKKFFVTLIACSAVLVGCNNDDDNGVDKETKIPVEERNALDDEAIQQYLEDFYFNPKNGKLTKFDTIKGNEDDAYPALKAIAKQDNIGIWYAENPHHKGTGKTIVSNDNSKISLNIEVKSFRGTNSSDYKRKYGSINSINLPNWNSINSGDGSAIQDPSYYYYIPTETETKNGVKREHVELKNFAEGLKHFKETERSVTDLYNFQGVIILPSRLAYGRNRVYGGANSGISDQFPAYRDISYIFNFELPKIEERVKK